MKKVFVSGTFDLLHKSHIVFLKDAKKQGDHLSVIVVSDNSVYENKGKYPINNQEKRIENIKKLNIADKVIDVGDNLYETLELICSLKPDIIVLGYDQKIKIKEVKGYLEKKGLKIKYYVSKEFAGGIHNNQLRD